MNKIEVLNPLPTVKRGCTLTEKEESLEKLEEIVLKLENGDVPLDGAIE